MFLDTAATVRDDPFRRDARVSRTLDRRVPGCTRRRSVPFEERILADGSVTPEEVEAAHDRVRRCLADSGLGINYDPDGGFELQSLDGKYPDGFFERSDPILRSCEKRADEYVTYLFEETRRNPERRDDAEITVPCLQAAGLVGKDYSEQQWRDDYDADTLPFDSTSDEAVQCRLDPLGLWRRP
ncbi:hypothetical protein [Curtobacterium pusillum]|uniref:hypothetical protein n=1 Tax=Curtobacterium pusillum TaxID=69373 RepID=UPI00119E03B9|nr:hypothetical protein [Curtobacterium pusillum]